MIELICINKNFSIKGKSTSILENININFHKGKLYGIMGDSGAGKSTLIQIIGLLIKPTTGIIKLNKKNTNNLKEKEISNLRKNKIAYIFQNYNLIPTMTAMENVMIAAMLNKSTSSAEKKKEIKELFDQLGLNNKENHYPSELSGGEQQRVAIARALINNPTIILADEPTAALDEKNAKNIFNILKKLSLYGKCIIVVCHNNLIKDYADEIIYLNNGRMENIDENI